MEDEEVIGVICVMPNCSFLSETSRGLEIYRALAARGAPARLAVHGGTYEWELSTLVRAMLADPSYKDNARRLKRLYDGVDGAAGAADAILDVLATAVRS